MRHDSGPNGSPLVIENILFGTKSEYPHSVRVTGDIGQQAEIAVNGDFCCSGKIAAGVKINVNGMFISTGTESMGARVVVRAKDTIFVKGGAGSTNQFIAGKNIVVRRGLGAGCEAESGRNVRISGIVGGSSKIKAAGLIKHGPLLPDVKLTPNSPDCLNLKDKNPLAM